MTRTIALVGVVALLFVAGIYIGIQWDSKQDIQEELDTTNEINDAQDACPDSLPWLERLQCLTARSL